MNKNYILMAVNKAGKNVYIDEVPNGKQCGCFCKECGGEIIDDGNSTLFNPFIYINGTFSPLNIMDAMPIDMFTR